MLRVLRDSGHGLDGRRAGADDGHPLVAELRHAAVGVAAGVAVVPPAGVERVSLELVDARDAGQLRPTRRAERHDDEARADVVVAVRADAPTLGRLIPVDGA